MTKPSERIKQIYDERNTISTIFSISAAILDYLDEEHEREERIFRNSHD